MTMRDNDQASAAELHRAAVGVVTAWHAATQGLVPLVDAPALLVLAGSFDGDPAELVVPLAGVALRLATLLAASATRAGEPSTVDDVLAFLGEEAATFDG